MDNYKRSNPEKITYISNINNSREYPEIILLVGHVVEDEAGNSRG